METRTLSLPDAEIVHDVHGPLPPADGGEVLLVIGQPMTADGFADLTAGRIDVAVRIAAQAAVELADESDPILDIFAERHERQPMPLFMS